MSDVLEQPSRLLILCCLNEYQGRLVLCVNIELFWRSKNPFRLIIRHTMRLNMSLIVPDDATSKWYNAGKQTLSNKPYTYIQLRIK